MKTYIIRTSEKIIYTTEINAKSYDEALDNFYKARIQDQSILVPEYFDNFSLESVEVNE